MKKDQNPKQKNIRQILKTESDIYAYHGTTEEEFMKNCQGLMPHEIGRRKEEYMVAAYNGVKLPEGFDTLPDWHDGKPKGYPWFYMDSPSGSRFSFDDHVYWFSDSRVGSRQVFYGPERLENLRDAATKFIEIYKQSRTF